LPRKPKKAGGKTATKRTGKRAGASRGS